MMQTPLPHFAEGVFYFWKAPCRSAKIDLPDTPSADVRLSEKNLKISVKKWKQNIYNFVIM